VANAYGDDITKREASEIVSYGYIRKPFLESEVEGKIRRAL
jgi:hypothetical protein